ncbi:hypothetical protein AUC68_06100 [Methyloceanibacter methanicus]|uniref:Uncharacterized protein n=1 Tax=Methyloceanibacter methanicus TaxID=1774968 RepID=A0A1E3VZ06_9HYPH|nr:hypothetical protein AUC68_06100 [Methyloceanibacter methanicus]
MGPDDKFCSACGTEVDASLELTDDARSGARQPSLSRNALVYFILAAVSTLVADFVEVQLAVKASWDIESTPALHLVYASLATGVFVILCIVWWRIFGGTTSAYFKQGLAVRVICLLLGLAIMFYGPITGAIYEWSDPEGPIWYQFDLLAALLATLFYVGYLAFVRWRSD